MANAKGRIKALGDVAKGYTKRLVGELTARPDLVLEGEDQETKGIKDMQDRPPAEPTAGDRRKANDQTS